MKISRREFLQLITSAAAAGLCLPGIAPAASGLQNLRNAGKSNLDLYDIPAFGNVSLLHFTDCHAQLLPSYYREPDTHIGTGKLMENKVPHLVGKYFLDAFHIPYRTPRAYALSFMDFPELAAQYGRTGGFAHLATLIKQLRAQRPGSLLLDGGDTWQGSATALWSKGQDMVDACKLLGVDVMTGHWEFTYGMDRVMEIVEKELNGHIDFVAQNVADLEFEDLIFPPYSMKEINGVQVAIIGQAFPYTMIAHPPHLVEKWQFGIHEERLQGHINKVREQGAQVVVLLSHNGMDVDLKLASRVRGLDAILGGHTHDGIPAAIKVNNAGGKTLVMNTGTNGKFVGVLDLQVSRGAVQDYRFHLLPVFSDLLPADAEMQEYIRKVRAPYERRLYEKVAETDSLLYRRDTFNGTFDQVILDALMKVQDAEIAFSPGFRWGTTLLPGTPITVEDVMDQTAITYPIVTRSEMTGKQIKDVLEDLADNRFSTNPYLQQGGDMVRVGGMRYSINIAATIGSRIEDMTLHGKPMAANKKYVVAGWANRAKDLKGQPVWDVVMQYCRDLKTVRVDEVAVPKLKHMKQNHGIQKPGFKV
jgi:sulfur-oxidizing protein SoxB